MNIEMVPISKLKLLQNNPRTISKEQMQKLCKSIEDDPNFLQCRPVLINRVEGVLNVYAGNQRVRAAKKLKMKEIPCIVEEFLTDEVIKERTIKDNKTYGEFDFDILANEWEVDMLVSCGFKPEELLGDLSNISDDGKVKDDDKKDSKTCETCGKKL